ncbi:MAG: ABC transporter substrate-binding protein [Myxococcaceae bacterium]
MHEARQSAPALRHGLRLVFLTLAACRPPAVPELTFRLGYPELPSTLLIYVAQDAQLFEAEHLRLEGTVYPTGRQALNAAMAGELDAAVPYSTPVVLSAMHGEDVVVLTTLHRADGLTGLAIHPATGIRTAADLRGRRIGVTPGTSSQLALDVVLAEGGLEASEIQQVPGQPKELVAALDRGTLDAASLWVPNLLLATGAGPGKARLLTAEVYTEMSMVAGQRAHLDTKRTEATRFLRALLRAQSLIRQRPELVPATLRGRFPELGESDLATILAHSRFELGLSNLLLRSLRQEAAWLEQRGEPRDQRVRLRNVVSPALLEELAPGSVTLLNPPERPFQ